MLTIQSLLLKQLIWILRATPSVKNVCFHVFSFAALKLDRNTKFVSPLGHPGHWKNVKLGGKDLDSGRAYQVTDDTVSVLVDHF